MSKNFWARTVIAMMLTCGATSAMAQLTGYDVNFSDATPAVLTDINVLSGLTSVPPSNAECNASPPNTIFSVNFTSGFSTLSNTIYGLEWDGGSGPDIFLYTLTDLGCSIGTRIGQQAVGFNNLESLLYYPPKNTFYSADFNETSHLGRLIRIDPATGTGEVVGEFMSEDIKIVGLTYDVGTGVIYGLTQGWGARSPELVTIDPETGLETLVGPTETAPNALQSLAVDNSLSSLGLYAAGSRLYEINPATGAATSIGGDFNGTVWAMFSNESVDENATFSNDELHIPVVVVSGTTDTYKVILALIGSEPELIFELVSAIPAFSPSNDKFTTYDSTTAIVHIPLVEVSGTNYTADLELIPMSNPLRFTLKSASKI